MKVKKILALLLATTMTVGTLTACGNEGGDQSFGSGGGSQQSSGQNSQGSQGSTAGNDGNGGGRRRCHHSFLYDAGSQCER